MFSWLLGNMKTLTRHSRDVTSRPRNKIICQRCNLICDSRSTLTIHMKKHHGPCQTRASPRLTSVSPSSQKSPISRANGCSASASPTKNSEKMNGPSKPVYSLEVAALPQVSTPLKSPRKVEDTPSANIVVQFPRRNSTPKPSSSISEDEKMNFTPCSSSSSLLPLPTSRIVVKIENKETNKQTCKARNPQEYDRKEIDKYILCRPYCHSCHHCHLEFHDPETYYCHEPCYYNSKHFDANCELKFGCIFCEKRFINRDKFVKHLVSHLYDRFVCRKCRHTTYFRLEMEIHVFEHLDEDNSPKMQAPVAENTCKSDHSASMDDQTCPKCEGIYWDQDLFKFHVSICTGRSKLNLMI